ncbi:MAG: hypothetical protein D6767_09620 [Candidatus Hydrogenedentota bacterium]|nr:MAG: hypothetical protein D6767_09620 [Candidatus Hydrogenedentota bacterium]
MQVNLPQKYLNDNELLELTKNHIYIEGYQGLIKIDRQAAIGQGSKLRISTIISGNSIIGQNCDIGLAGGAVLAHSTIGAENIITNGARVFDSATMQGVKIYGGQVKNSVIHKNSVLRPNATVVESHIGERNKIKMMSSVLYSHLEDYVMIGTHSLIKRSVIGENSKVGDYTKISGAQIGENVLIGDYTHIKGNPDAQDVRIEDNVKIGNHVVIEAGSVVYAGSKIPDYAVVYTRGGRTVMSIVKMDE